MEDAKAAMTGQQAALDLMRQQRWSEAAAAFAACPADPASQMHGRIAANLAAMQIHQPAACRAILSGSGEDRYQIVATPSGRPTIACHEPDGRWSSLSVGPDPLAGAQAVMAQIRQVEQAHPALAVCGVGDGYLLAVMGQCPPQLPFGRLPTVYIIEPDAKAALAALMLHDYSTRRGPIVQHRFVWVVGPTWEKDLLGMLRQDGSLAYPPVHIHQGRNREQVNAGLGRVAVEYAESAAGEDTGGTSNQHLATSNSTGNWQRATGNSSSTGNSPRVLLITTRFSTVLQYSTADTAAAFRELGWDARVLIEPSPARIITPLAIRRAVAKYAPDLVFQIDHARFEHPRAIPDSTPFACWIQDAMPKLNSPQAAAKIKPRDFFLTAMALYRDEFGYPARQIVPVHRLTRIPRRPAEWASDGPDLAYVSNASEDPRQRARNIVAENAESPELARLLEAGGNAIIASYERGEALVGQRPLADLVEALPESTLLRETPQLRRPVIDLLYGRLNDLLYRQQALRWAARIAGRLNLRFDLYGSGWDKHPDLAPHARGTVAYGEALERLTRSVKINLQVEPNLGTSHQRLLDGLVAGGFYLVREHISMSLFPDIVRLLASSGAGEARSTADAMRRLDREAQQRLQQLIARGTPLSGTGDVIEQAMRSHASGLILAEDRPLPRMRETVFHDEASLEERIRHFLADEPGRRDIAAAQRQAVEDNLSYTAGVRRLIEHVQRCLAEEAGAGKAAA